MTVPTPDLKVASTGSDSGSSTHPPAHPSARLMVKAGLATLIIGQGVGALAIIKHGPPADAPGIPPWIFPLVWTALFPCFGVASLLALAQSTRACRVQTAFAGAAAASIAILWVPIASLASSLRANVVLDLVACIVFLGTAVVYARASRRALVWLVPLLVWMPITTAISLFANGAL